MVKFLVMDVDGTLTDGKIYMSNEGELFKTFSIKDGYGIKDMLPVHDIIPVIITARRSVILQNRCRELGITELYQGERQKLDCLKKVILKYCKDGCDYTLADTAYIGDDILDLQCIKPIREARGLTGCPADAVQEVKDCCDYVAPHRGGDGAVRDFIEYIVKKRSTES